MAVKVLPCDNLFNPIHLPQSISYIDFSNAQKRRRKIYVPEMFGVLSQQQEQQIEEGEEEDYETMIASKPGSLKRKRPQIQHDLLSDFPCREEERTETSHMSQTPEEEDEEDMVSSLTDLLEKMKFTYISTSKYDSPSQIDKEHKYPPLEEEPKVDESLMCRIAVRLPDGRKLQRNFLRTDPIQLLWSFCSSHLEEPARPFRLALVVPGASKCVDYMTKLSFHESGLHNTLISVIWH